MSQQIRTGEQFGARRQVCGGLPKVQSDPVCWILHQLVLSQQPNETVNCYFAEGEKQETTHDFQDPVNTFKPDPNLIKQVKELIFLSGWARSFHSLTGRAAQSWWENSFVFFLLEERRFEREACSPWISWRLPVVVFKESRSLGGLIVTVKSCPSQWPA